MNEDEHPNYGRRMADRLARYGEVLLLGLISALLGVVIYFYADMPKRLSEMVAVQRETQLEIVYIKEEIRDLKEAQRVSQNWRERLVDLEKQVDRNSAINVQQDRRLDKLEDQQPRPLFGGSGKKAP